MADKLTDAARFYKGLKEQTDAFNWLETTIPADKLKEFFVKYRTNASAQDTYTNDWDGVTAAAKVSGAKYPELVAAQWALESSWGKHVSGKNNYFGLKGSGTNQSTQEFIDGNWITITDGLIFLTYVLVFPISLTDGTKTTKDTKVLTTHQIVMQQQNNLKNKATQQILDTPRN